jgi:hypothetical protein
MTEPSSDVLSRERDEAALWALATGSSQPDGDELRAPVVFRSQPKPIDARHRVAYRTALLVLTLSRFNRNAAKLANLHLLMWATRSARTRRLLSAWWSGRRFANTVTQRLDPDLQVTLNLALVDGLVEPAGADRQRVRLTDKGVALVGLIDAENELLAVEKAFLATLAPLSDAAVARHLGGSL